MIVKQGGKTQKQYKFKKEEDWMTHEVARELGITPSTLPTPSEPRYPNINQPHGPERYPNMNEKPPPRSILRHRDDDE